MNPIPKSIIVNTGDQEKNGIQKIIDNFFLETSEEWINQDPSRIKEHLEIKIGDHYYFKKPSENRTTYLSYKEQKILAGVVETRTEDNKINYIFFRNI